VLLISDFLRHETLLSSRQPTCVLGYKIGQERDVNVVVGCDAVSTRRYRRFGEIHCLLLSGLKRGALGSQLFI